MNAARYMLGLATLAVGLGVGIYLWSLLHDDPEGHTVTIVFDRVDGLEVGATVRYRGVPVGEVRNIRLGSSGETVEAVCAFEPAARPTLRATSRFWIVRPRFLGVARGASGLETLVKDSYIAYTSPAGAERLPEGAYVPGLPAPPDESQDAIGRGQRGDLEITILFHESGDLRPGARVRHRGLDVGVVTMVGFARSGKGVRVDARVDREHRGHVTDHSRFWVARPRVEAGWLSGVDVHHLESLLGDVHLVLHTPTESVASPARDRASFIGETEPVDVDWKKFTSSQLASEAQASVSNGSGWDGASLVRVHYSFMVKRWWATNPTLARRTTGVAYRTADGLPAVLVARSAVDAKWSPPEERGTVEDRGFRVELEDGSIVDAGRVWVPDDDADLAILIIDESASIPESRIHFQSLTDTTVELASLAEDGKIRTDSAVLAASGSVSGASSPEHGAIVIVNGVPIAIAVGTRAWGFDRVPDSLRTP